MRKIRILVLAALFVGGCSDGDSMLTIHTSNNNVWGGLIDNGSLGSGQSFTIHSPTFNFFDEITFDFAEASNGMTFGFILSDALTGGNTLFAGSFTVVGGKGSIIINTQITAGETIWALIDYNGFTGETAHINAASEYDFGNSAFLDTGGWNESPTFEHQFIAKFSSKPVVPPGVSLVDIDIKPGSDPNCFNLNGHGVIPVAILGSDKFDVTNIDQGSLYFGGLEIRVRGNKGPLCGLEYSNADAYLDLVCQFEDDPNNWDAGDAEAVLEGSLFDLTDFGGIGSICVVP